MAYIPLNNAPIVKKEIAENFNEHDALSLLQMRQMLNGSEGVAITKLTPMQTNLEVLYLQNSQVSEAIHNAIATEFGRQLEPAITQFHLDSGEINKQQTIELSLKTNQLGTHAWTDGIMLLTNSRSSIAKTIYASMHDLQLAQKYGSSFLNDQGPKTIGIYADPDLIHRFKYQCEQSQVPEVTLSDLLDQLKNEMNSIKTSLASLRYRDPDTVISTIPDMISKAETLQIIVAKVSSISEQREKEQVEQIKHLEKNLEESRQVREEISKDMEEQLTALQQTNAQYKDELKNLTTVRPDASLQELEELKCMVVNANLKYETTCGVHNAKLNSLQIEVKRADERNAKLTSELEVARETLRETERNKRHIEEGQELCASSDVLHDLQRDYAKRTKKEPKRETKMDETSSEEDEVDQRVPTTSGPVVLANDDKPRLATPSKFGMRNFNPATANIFQHIQQLRIGIKQAETQGYEKENIQNLVLLTLPSEFEYIQDFMSDDDKNSVESFLSRIIELIEGSKTDQLSSFLRQHRKPNENILAYFSRMKNLYKHSLIKTATLETDTFGIRILYQKVYEAMTMAQAAELQRLCETKLTAGDLKFSELQTFVAQASRKQNLPSPTLAAASNLQLHTVPSPKLEANNMGSTEKRTCYYCQKIGHLKRNCFQLNKDRKNGCVRRSTDSKNEKTGRQDTPQNQQ